MIKEILLSLAVAAVSGVSSFVGSPKRVITGASEAYGLYEFTLDIHGTDYYDYGWENPFMTLNNQQVGIGDGWVPCSDNNDKFGFSARGDLSNNQIDLSIYLTWKSTSGEVKSAIVSSIISALGGSPYQGFSYSGPYSESYGVDVQFSRSVPLEDATYSLSFTLTGQYTLTKNYINCDIASSPILPDTFTSSSQLSYYVLMVSNAGGYGFTSESVTQTGGITIRNFSLFDQYNNSGYYASCSFNVDLPLNDCSITIQAFLPTYTITTNLERCTVSPAIPSSYTGTSFSGNYTFTAVNGYGFNKNYTHWEVTNLFIDSVEFSALLWGSFYSSVTLHLRASGGNSSISVTAIEYDEANYKLGYEEGREDGWQAGYDRGHADGEMAGNSYGVWNWLKQAALTTGEFLSIPLLPGFSIGGLLTAIAGLVIIWFFIKGFLFKS